MMRHPEQFGALAVLAVAVVILLLSPAASARGQENAAAGGKQVFDKRCGGCHALDRDKEGPHLRGVYGRAAGSVDSFGYSDALKNAKFTWDDASLEKWLTDPEQLVPNNAMAFHLESAGERREVITYLKQNSSSQ